MRAEREWDRVTRALADSRRQMPGSVPSLNMVAGMGDRRGADGNDDWAAWLERHGAALVLIARQWAPVPADAEDVVQEAFVRFWRSRGRANDAVAYLYACVRAAAIDGARSSQRRLRRETK